MISRLFCYIGILSTLALLAGCSHSSRPPNEPQLRPEVPVLQKIIPNPEKPPQTQETAKTIIPPEEKKAATEAMIEEKNGSDKDSVAITLEDALTAYQEAKTFREGGDLEGAIKALDRAYALMLKADVPVDSPLAQEKTDLRILIAQRVQEIYAIRSNPAANGGNAILLVENKWVTDEIKSFQTIERASFMEAYKRSGLYRPMITAELAKMGMPEELSWLPVIESGFMTRALSRARALGMWQFIASTGYRYGLTRDQWVDERMDPDKATRAALKFLNDLHTAFGDWSTALAAYNCGEFGVQRVINTQHINYLDDFWDLFTRLPFQTARFVPRFMAVVLITKNPAKYGFTLPSPYSVLNTETVTVNKPAKLSTLSTALGLEATELAFLNPELRLDSTPDRSYDLKVPAGYAEKALLAIATIPKYVPPEMSYAWYTIKSGDTLWMIARKFKTSIDMITKLNGFQRNSLLLPGRRIKIPGKV